MYKYAFNILMVSCFIASGCFLSDTETITVKDDHGKLSERYSRNKKNYDKQGKLQRFYPDGTIKEEAEFQANKLNGQRKLFYQTGTIESEENYKMDVLEGSYKKYYPNGAVQLEMTYQNGVLTGQSRAWYPNGTLKEEVSFKDNEENGPFIEYHENGNLKAKGQYLDGPNEQDSLYLYDQSGQLERVMFCQMGVCHTAYGKPAAQ